MTLKQHVYAAKAIVNSGIPSDDSRLTNSLVEHFLIISRSKLLEQKLNKLQQLSDTDYQSFCLDLEKVTYHDCDCTTDPDCLILRSTKKLPMYIRSSKWSTLKIRFVDGRNIDRSNITSNILSKYSNTKQDQETKYFIDNQYVYILNHPDLKKIGARAVWSDPSALDNYTSCINSDSSCYDSLNDEFPIDAGMVYDMYTLANNKIREHLGYPEDTLNDSADVKVSTTK